MIQFVIGTALSLFGIGQAHIAGIKQGKTNDEILKMLEAQKEQTKNLEKQFVKLSDKILYNPNANVVKDTIRTAQKRVDDLRTIRQELEPIQNVLGNNILASAMITTPQKLQELFGQNPSYLQTKG